MDVREKLVELLDNAIIDSDDNYGFPNTNQVADHLIANGVTVQEWISVNDRLPEKNTTVLASTDNGIVFQCLFAYDGWDLWEGHEVNITHWQPMPEPPKGV